jgi:hypothetical protein
MICRYFGTTERQVPEWQVFGTMMIGGGICIGFDAIGFFLKKVWDYLPYSS